MSYKATLIVCYAALTESNRKTKQTVDWDAEGARRVSVSKLKLEQNKQIILHWPQVLVLETLHWMHSKAEQIQACDNVINRQILQVVH